MQPIAGIPSTRPDPETTPSPPNPQEPCLFLPLAGMLACDSLTPARRISYGPSA
jgi:hypothetical protein